MNIWVMIISHRLGLLGDESLLHRQGHRSGEGDAGIQAREQTHNSEYSKSLAGEAARAFFVNVERRDSTERLPEGFEKHRCSSSHSASIDTFRYYGGDPPLTAR